MRICQDNRNLIGGILLLDVHQGGSEELPHATSQGRPRIAPAAQELKDSRAGFFFSLHPT